MCLCACITEFVFTNLSSIFCHQKLCNTSIMNSPKKKIKCIQEINSLLQVNCACSFYVYILYHLFNEVKNDLQFTVFCSLKILFSGKTVAVSGEV